MNYDKLKHNVKEFLLEYFDYMARITEPTVEDYKINKEKMKNIILNTGNLNRKYNLI